MDRSQGAFIVIEGTDGSGKATQFELLLQKLQSEGYEVEVFDFPQYDKPSSYFVREYLNGNYGSAEDVGPYTASIFYALDRFEAAPRIREALAAGKTVIANRFTGSNMAHQGTKFEHSEERNGYFLWLEAIEFKMLGIPRPDLSLILRVPAELAQVLVDQKTTREYTDKKRDLHESDIEHLRRSVEVYDDLSRLFPKDFKQLDCVRGDELLSIEAVHNLVWETIMPTLPPKKPKKNAKTTAKKRTFFDESAHGDDSTLQLAGQHVVLEGISSLLINKLAWGRLHSYQEQSTRHIFLDQRDDEGRYKYVIPPNLNAHTKKHYVQIMDRIFDNYAQMVHELTAYVQAHSVVPKAEQNKVWRESTRAQACDAISPVLPVAIKSSIRIFASGHAFESLILRLRSDEVAESRETSEKILNAVRKVIPTFLEGAKESDYDNVWLDYRSKTTNSVKKLTEKYLPKTYSNSDDEVRLTSAWPRNELDLVPDMIYEHASHSLAEIKENVNAWTYEQKQKVFTAYMGERLEPHHRPGRALEKAHYSWDILCDYRIFCDLQRHRMIDDLNWQKLTPRYGYEIPELVEDAGLTDMFEECFDLSVELYDLMQAGGYELEAQYATLLGHRMRWKVTFNAREAFQLIELRSTHEGDPGCRKVTVAMHEKIKEIHPMLADAMKFVDQSEDPRA